MVMGVRSTVIPAYWPCVTANGSIRNRIAYVISLVAAAMNRAPRLFARLFRIDKPGASYRETGPSGQEASIGRILPVETMSSFRIHPTYGPFSYL
jgi:hypothetical protein